MKVLTPFPNYIKPEVSIKIIYREFRRHRRSNHAKTFKPETQLFPPTIRKNMLDNFHTTMTKNRVIHP